MTIILTEDALQNLKIPITRSVFRDLPLEDNIKILIYDVSPSISKEEEKQEEEDTELDGDEMGEEGTNIEDDAKIEEKEGIETEEEMKQETDRDEKEKTERKKALKKKGKNKRRSHVGCLQRSLSRRQQLPSLLSVYQSSKKGKGGGKSLYISEQERAARNKRAKWLQG